MKCICWFNSLYNVCNQLHSCACCLTLLAGPPAQNVLQQNCNPITTVLQPHQHKIHILDNAKQVCTPYLHTYSTYYCCRT